MEGKKIFLLDIINLNYFFFMEKMLFLKIRKACIFSEERQTMLNEVYWMSGFVFFYFDQILHENESKSTLIEMETFDFKNNTKMQIIIKCNEHPEPVFQSVHQSVKEFVSQWMVPNLSKEINYKTFKKSLEHEDAISLNSNCNERKLKALCYYCGYEILFNKKSKNCEFCYSDNFLIENQFAILKVVAQGGFGRIFKALHIETEVVVSIKERKFEEEKFVESWNEEISSLHFIDTNIPLLKTPKLIGVLNDSSRQLAKKYLVLEWVEGGNMKAFHQKRLHHSKFNNEIDFLRLFLMLINQLHILHSKNCLHRDIKTENLMFFERNNYLYFILIDFGSFFQLNSKNNKLKTISLGYSPPEQNTDEETFKSDIYSLSVSLLEILFVSKINLDQMIIKLLERMKEKEIEKRPHLNEIQEYLKQFCKEKYFCEKMELLEEFLDSLEIPDISKDYQLVKEKTRDTFLTLNFSNQIKREEKREKEIILDQLKQKDKIILSILKEKEESEMKHKKR